MIAIISVILILIALLFESSDLFAVKSFFSAEISEERQIQGIRCSRCSKMRQRKLQSSLDFVLKYSGAFTYLFNLFYWIYSYIYIYVCVYIYMHLYIVAYTYMYYSSLNLYIYIQKDFD